MTISRINLLHKPYSLYRSNNTIHLNNKITFKITKKKFLLKTTNQHNNTIIIKTLKKLNLVER
jgi:hypothetical protein